MFLWNSDIQTEQDKLTKNIRNNAMCTTGLKPPILLQTTTTLRSCTFLH
jgi:hypothetical protein